MRIPKNFLNYLVMHQECNERLLASARSFAPQDLDISPDPEAKRLRKMVYAVMGEVHRMLAFVRLKPLGSQVLWGYLKPRHLIGGHVCDHLARRTPEIIVVLGNGSESWTAFFWEGRILRDHGEGINKTLERLRFALEISEESANADGPDVDDIWQVYYDSQYCPERKNLAAFHSRMPRRDQDAAGLRLVQNKKEITLEDFLW